jgi:hypothetical protein
VIVAGIDGRDHGLRIVGGDERRGKSGKRR